MGRVMEKTYLDIPAAQCEYAVHFGAILDHEVNRYYVVGNVPVELESYLPEESYQDYAGDVPEQCPVCGSALSLQKSPGKRMLFYRLLGGTDVFGHIPIARSDWVRSVREGFPYACAPVLAGYLSLTDAQLAKLLGCSSATLIRRQHQGRFTMEESARILRSSRILERALLTFKRLDTAVTWLNCRNLSMGDVAPISLLDTEFGAEEVNRELGGIERWLSA